MMKFFATTYSKNITNISFDNQSIVGNFFLRSIDLGIEIVNFQSKITFDLIVVRKCQLYEKGSIFHEESKNVT